MSTLDNLSSATQAVCDEIARAQKALNCDIICNGYGIMADPLHVRGSLSNAKVLIDRALAIMQATKWPREADYDALEREHNRP